MLPIREGEKFVELRCLLRVVFWGDRIVPDPKPVISKKCLLSAVQLVPAVVLSPIPNHVKPARLQPTWQSPMAKLIISML